MNETDETVDNLGGILSAVLVGSLILSINFAPVPNMGTLVIGLALVAVAATVEFVIRQRRAGNPLYDLDIAARPTFWVAALAGIVVFGSLMGAMFIGQQYLQNVLGYSTLAAGASILPAAVLMVIVAPRSAKLVEARGARFTLLLGYVFVTLGFLTMLLLWQEGSPYAVVGLGYGLVGVGVGFAGMPASRSLTGSVPVTRAGMASGTSDLQRDLGGAIMWNVSLYNHGSMGYRTPNIDRIGREGAMFSHRVVRGDPSALVRICWVRCRRVPPPQCLVHAVSRPAVPGVDHRAVRPAHRLGSADPHGRSIAEHRPRRGPARHAADRVPAFAA